MADWVSVKTRLPELHADSYDGMNYLISEPVLVVYNGDEMIIAAYEIDKDETINYYFEGWVTDDSRELHTVTHWRPLPPLPGDVVT